MLRRLPGALAITLTFAVQGCSKKADPHTAAPAVPSAVPAPKGLVAELAFARPGATWASVRTAIGGPATMLPASGGLLATTIFDLPPTAAELFDMDIPAFGAVIEDDGRFAVVLALHVKDGPKLAEIASTGENARFTKKPDAASGVLLLDAQNPDPGPALGVSGNYLTVASRSSDLTRFAPFVTRTLPSRPVPKEDVVAVAPRQGLSHLVWFLTTALTQTKQELAAIDAMVKAETGSDAPSRQADLVLAHADRALGFVSDFADARLSLSLTDGFAQLRLAAKPEEGGGVASQYLAKLAKGDAKPLLDMPAESAFALMMRENQQAREEGVSQALASLGELESMPPAQKALIEQTLTALAKARGDVITGGALWDRHGLAFIGMSSINEEELFAKTIPEILKLAKSPAFAQSFEALGGQLDIGAVSKQAGIHSVRVTRKPDAIAKSPFTNLELLPAQLDLVWSVESPQVSFALAGKEARKLLDSLKLQTGKLKENADVSRLVEGIDGDVSAAILVQPRKIMSELTGKPAGEQAPVLVSFGGTGTQEVWLRIDMSQFALRDLAMLASGM